MKSVHKAFIVFLILALTFPLLPTSSGQSAPDPVVTEGTNPFAIMVGAVRYRAFKEGIPDSDPEVYLGVPNINSPQRRTEMDLQWDSNNVFTFTYDTVHDWLSTEVENTYGNWSLTYPDFSSNVTAKVFNGDEQAAAEKLNALNYFEILITLKKDQPTEVDLYDVHLDGYFLGNFSGMRDDKNRFWMVTGHDLSDGFVVTGTIHISATDTLPDDFNKIELSFGYADQEGPVTTEVTADPNPLFVGQTTQVRAYVNDSTTGGIDIASAEYSLDGGTSWSPMGAQDGAFDEIFETVTATTPVFSSVGSYDLCVRGTDVQNNTGAASCLKLFVLPVGDDQGPVTADVAADPNPALAGNPLTFTATVDDSTTGGSPLASAEYALNGGAWMPMDAQDGDFDQVSEAVTASSSDPLTPGSYSLCVRGTDRSDNTGEAACITLEVSSEPVPSQPTIYLPFVSLSFITGVD